MANCLLIFQQLLKGTVFPTQSTSEMPSWRDILSSGSKKMKSFWSIMQVDWSTLRNASKPIVQGGGHDMP